LKREESGYSMRPEQVANGITRKEKKQIECVHKRKKNGLMRQSDKQKKMTRTNQGNSSVGSKNLKRKIQDFHICVKTKTTLSSLNRIKS